MPKALSPLAELLARRTREGELYEKLADKRVRCFACGHRCLIPPGFDGVCRVRFNEDGVLKVPHGYVGALQLDPIEKKPFFHALPGAKALSFGMLGCDYHCGYCFTGDTTVLTGAGATTFADLHASCDRAVSRGDAELAFPAGVHTVSASGQQRLVKGVVRHRYTGAITVLAAHDLPPLRCTPDHRVLTTPDPSRPPAFVAAKDVEPGHYLVVPRRFGHGTPGVIDVHRLLAEQRVTHRVPRRIPEDGRALVLMASTEQEHRPGLPAELPVTPDLAALLGYYCAQGSVIRASHRPNSLVLAFAFSRTERAVADRVKALLWKCLGLGARIVERETTLCVQVGNAGAALLFSALAGAHGHEKRVPAAITGADQHAIRAFLHASVDGGGHRHPGGGVQVTTVSRALADGIAFLAVKSGWLPAIDRTERCAVGLIQGRDLTQAPAQYAVAWSTEPRPLRHAVATEEAYLVRVWSVGSEAFDGHVYNMEVEEEHSYLAGFFGVSNCQNWVTSQALRDPAVQPEAQEIEAAGITRLAQRYGAQVVTSTYNEPLITSEWAVDVFRHARAAGLVCSYVSNGNGTAEVLEYIRPFVQLYKVDLKSFRDRHYRELGGTLERVLWTISALHEMGFWLEIVTLVIPGFNDSDAELTDIARFLVSVSPDIPWHVTAFHKDYRMTDPDNTPAATLLRAAEIGTREGLRYVYAGNIPGSVGRWENTWCPACRALLIERVGYRVRQDRVSATGSCPDCSTAIAGFWR